jgi:peptide/nickel transport system substrate-binding protein
MTRIFWMALEGERNAASERDIRVSHLVNGTLIRAIPGPPWFESELAEAWEVSNGGLRLKARLRKDLKFHDGTPITAETVRPSFDSGSRWESSTRQLLSDLIEEVIGKDDMLVFDLKFGGWHLLSRIDVISPAAIKDSAKPGGAGPWLIDPVQPQGDRIILKPSGIQPIPKLGQVHCLYIPKGDDVADLLLRQGELDFAPTVSDPNSIAKLRNAGHVIVVDYPAYNIFYLGFYTEKPPFDKPLMREAAVRAIDVGTMAGLGLGAAVAAVGPVPPGIPGHDPTIRQPSFDPALARDLLRRAGYNGAQLNLLHFNATSYMNDVAKYIHASLNGVGMNVSLSGFSSLANMVSAVKNRDGHMFIYSWHVRDIDTSDPYRFLAPLFHSRNIDSTNLTHFEDKSSTPDSVDELLDQKRDGQLLQQKIRDRCPMVFLSHWHRMAAYHRRVTHLDLGPGALPTRKLVSTDK